MNSQEQWLNEFLACRKNYDKEDKAVWNHTMQTYASAFKSEAIGEKDKHLMALCVGVAEHCQPCTLGHLKVAISTGATKEEILETIGVAISMCGTMAMGGAWMVFQYMDEQGLL